MFLLCHVILEKHIENEAMTIFYLSLDNGLYLGPFMGKTACLYIEYNKGVVGTSAYLNETIVVKDVHKFKGHIACDSNSKSEICIPININNNLYAILDIDSPLLERFSENDKNNLEDIAKIIENSLASVKLLLD